MFQLKVFILKFGTIDALSTSAIVVGEVTTLTHEVGDDTVEGAAFVAKALLTSAQCTEVLCRLGDHVSTQLQKKVMQNIDIGSCQVIVIIDIKFHRTLATAI